MCNSSCTANTYDQARCAKSVSLWNCNFLQKDIKSFQQQPPTFFENLFEIIFMHVLNSKSVPRQGLRVYFFGDLKFVKRIIVNNHSEFASYGSRPKSVLKKKKKSILRHCWNIFVTLEVCIKHTYQEVCHICFSQFLVMLK